MSKNSADTPVMRQYLSAKAEYPDAVLFFRMGDFYEMFFEDAVITSAALDIALTSRDKGKEDAVPMCGFPHHALPGYLTRMVEAGHKVAVCDQMEDPRKAKGIVKRAVTRVVTSGVILDAEQLDAKVSNYLMALSWDGGEADPHGPGEGGSAGSRGTVGGGEDEDLLGLAFLDASTGEFLTAELPGGQGLLDEIARVRPRQILVPRGSLGGLRQLCPGLGSLRLEEAPEGIFGDDQGDHDLLAEATDASPEWVALSAGARRASAAVIRYIRTLFPGRELPPFRLVPYQVSAYLVLDEATLANLEIFETIMERRRQGSLLGVLDQTVTAMGARLLRRSLAFPLAIVEEILRRQEAVAFLVERAGLRDSLRRAMKGLHDLERLNRRAACGLATPRDLGAMASSLRAVPVIVGLVAEAAAGQTLEALPELLQPPEDDLGDLAARLSEVLVPEPPVGCKDGGIIRPGFSAELDELVSLADGGKEQILAIEARERDRTGLAGLRIRYNRVFGYTIEVSRSKAREVPPEYVRKQTLANVERYVTPELSEHEARVLGAEEKRVELEERLFVGLREEVAAAESRIGRLAERLATLDMLAAFAEVSSRNDYCRPRVDDGDLIRIQDGRHPVVEQIVGPGRFVPNDLSLSSGEDQVVIVTGPNMAGKSTIIRQAALITLMAHTGCFVPARAATVGVVDRIFTRVGASDNLARGQSTFMVEMKESANILRYATSRSLVVLDEIGRGTSTYDGVSIAWAVAEFLHDRIRTKTLFATHFHELCSLEDVKPRVRNRSVAVREVGGEVVFLHKLVRGGSSRSHGIGVAKLAGLPQEVVERARQILDHLERGADADAVAARGLPLLAPQLSLFGEVGRAPERPAQPEASDASSKEALRRLRELEPDSLSPRQAQEILYELRELARKGDDCT
ncbi:MAG: DNA mismatch repair protein MutS [Polyangia bacterium]|jgi:DNA mismatch repair protein MutS|nr:DNA mismatch repair protein MutS [Polyangia bacterium]